MTGDGMTTETERMPIIQKAEDDKYVRINEDCFEQQDDGTLKEITIEQFAHRTMGKELITWDYRNA